MSRPGTGTERDTNTQAAAVRPSSGSRGGPVSGWARGYSADAWRYVTYSFGSGFSQGFLAVLLGLYVLSIGYSESFLATQELVLAVCAAGFSLVAGVVVDRLGTRFSLLLSAGAIILGRTAMVSYPSAAVILGATVIVSVGIAFFWVSQGVTLAQVSTPEQRAGLFGLNWTAFTASAFLGGVVAGALPSVLGPAFDSGADSPLAYRYTVWVGVAVLLLCSLPLLWMSTGKQKAEHAAVREKWWKVEAPGKLARLLIPVSAGAAAAAFTLPFMSVFFQGTFSASTRNIGLTVGLFSLIGSLGGFLGPALSRRYGAVRTVSALLVVSAPVALLIGYAPGFGVAAGALWLRGLLQNSAWPVALAFLIDSVPEGQRGRASALMNVSYEVAWATCTLPAGLIMQHVSYRLPYVLSAAALLLGGLAYAYAFRSAPARTRTA